MQSAKVNTARSIFSVSRLKTTTLFQMLGQVSGGNLKGIEPQPVANSLSLHTTGSFSRTLSHPVQRAVCHAPSILFHEILSP